MHIEYKSNYTKTEISNEEIICLDDVSVCYRIPKERIPSIKEFAIQWLKRKVTFVDYWALSNLNLKVRKGEVLGVIGPNGAGKSTLFKIIARVLRPKKGRIIIRGKVAPLLELAAGFDFELTGRDNVFLNGAILGFSKQNISSRFNRIVEFAGLKDFIDAPLRTYSTGMVARLGFSIATDIKPDILLIDELLSVGDEEFQEKSIHRIKKFQKIGTTILLVSHSMSEIESMCNRVLWLNKGKLVTIGSKEQVIQLYQQETALK